MRTGQPLMLPFNVLSWVQKLQTWTAGSQNPPDCPPDHQQECPMASMVIIKLPHHQESLAAVKERDKLHCKPWVRMATGALLITLNQLDFLRLVLSVLLSASLRMMAKNWLHR